MADKVLRFTAEDSGYGQAIDRMAGKMRSAFDMNSVLAEADTRFTSLGDKVKFVKEQLASAGISILNMKKSNSGYDPQGRFEFSNEDVLQYSSRYGKLSQDRATIPKDEKVVDRLVESLDRLGEKVEEANEKNEPGGGGQEPPPTPPIVPGGGGGRGGRKGGGSSFLSDAFSVATGVGIERFLEGILGGIRDEFKTGVDLARKENVLNRQFQIDPDTLSDAGGRTLAPYQLGVNNKEFLEAIGQTAGSRRIGTDAVNETLNRLRLTGSYGVSPDQLGGIDKFYRQRNGGDLLDRSQFDASRTIVEILARSDRQGILGVSHNDFTMLPEKIGQVTSIMQQQYSNSERTNANQAINLMLAGNRIGGRFGDDRAADTFGRLNEGIVNPHSPGTKAFILEALRRANPGKTPLELEAQMQEGINSPENVKAIFPYIQGIRSREMRGRILQSLGLDAQSSLRLADAGNLSTFTQAAGGGISSRGLTPQEYTDKQKEIQTRAEGLTLTQDKAMTYFSNSVTSFGEAVTKFIDGATKQAANVKEIYGNPKEPKNNKVISPGMPARLGF